MRILHDFLCHVSSFFIHTNVHRNYDNTSGTALQMPIKWLALECIRNRIYSHKSDVWSFGKYSFYRYYHYIVFFISAEAWEYVFTGVGLSVCLSVTTITKLWWQSAIGPFSKWFAIAFAGSCTLSEYFPSSLPFIFMWLPLPTVLRKVKLRGCVGLLQLWWRYAYLKTCET